MESDTPDLKYYRYDKVDSVPYHVPSLRFPDTVIIPHYHSRENGEYTYSLTSEGKVFAFALRAAVLSQAILPLHLKVDDYVELSGAPALDIQDPRKLYGICAGKDY